MVICKFGSYLILFIYLLATIAENVNAFDELLINNLNPIEKDSIQTGCAPPHICKSVGCILDERNNLFICCCSNSFCNGKSKGLVKARWQMFRNGDYRPMKLEQEITNDSMKKRLLSIRNVDVNGPTLGNGEATIESTSRILPSTSVTTTSTTTQNVDMTKEQNSNRTTFLTSTSNIITTTTTTTTTTTKPPNVTTKFSEETSKNFTKKIAAKITTKSPSRQHTNTTKSVAKKKKVVPKKLNAKNNQTTKGTTTQATTPITLSLNGLTNDGTTGIYKYTTATSTELPDYKTFKKMESQTLGNTQQSIAETKPKTTTKNTLSSSTSATIATTTTTMTSTTTATKSKTTKKVEVSTRLPPIKASSAATKQPPTSSQKDALETVKSVSVKNNKQEAPPKAPITTAPKIPVAAPKMTDSMEPLTNIILQKSASMEATNRTTRYWTIPSVSSTSTTPAIRQNIYYRSFPWYFVVVFGFIVSLVVFAIAYFILKRCKAIAEKSKGRRGPRESLQHIKDIDDSGFTGVSADDDNGPYTRLNQLEHSSASLLRKKTKNKNRSFFMPFKSSNSTSKKGGSLIKSNANGTTNDSLASHCTTVTTISAVPSTISPTGKSDKSTSKSSKTSSPTKSRASERDEDRELTVIDPLLNKQYTGTIHISAPLPDKTTKH